MPREQEDDEAVLQAEVDQGVEHREGSSLGGGGHSQQPAPMAPFMISVLSRNAPLVTTLWPGFRPQVDLDDVAPVGRLGHDPLRPVDAPRPRGGRRGRRCPSAGRPPWGRPRPCARSPIWISAWPNWLARSRPSGLASSARTRVVRVCSLTSVPTQVTWPRDASLLVRARPRDGEARPPGRASTFGDVRLVDVDPEPHPRGVGDGEELRRRLDRLALDGVPQDDRPVDRGDDVEQVPRVLGLEDLGELGVVEAEVPELLLGVHQARLGLVQGGQGLELRPCAATAPDCGRGTCVRS